MYPVLILRAEIVCLVILVFLCFTSRSYNIDRNARAFRRLLMFGIIHVCFDIITVITVNNVDTVAPWINWICHIVFYLSAICYSNELANYVIALCYPKYAKRFYAFGHIAATVYLCCLPLLEIAYEDTSGGTWSSSGPAAYAGYGLAFVFFLSALLFMLFNMKKLPRPIRIALIPMMAVLMVVEISQVVWRSLLFTGCAITIVTVGFFFSLENPVQVFKRKAMTDALTGVRSRSSYETDIENFDRKFKTKPGDEYTFVFCDLNGLRNINNRFGHPEGDNYITLIASSINRCMKHATSVYRIGGDEFLILYYKVNEDTIVREISELQKDCMKSNDRLNYVPSVSVGYARSSANYKSLKDVVKTADYAMYQNKSEMKQNIHRNTSLGSRANYVGLTDKIFDAMCSSNDRNYPYLTNLETNVTRISPAWKEFFGLDSEFFTDFNSVWEKRIHPDYLEGFKEDIASVMNGHQKYHNYEYLAKKADGEYVRVSCHGSVYRDNSDSCSYFSGFMVNHALDERRDPVTGLREFEKLTAKVSTLMDNCRPFSVLKLNLNNFARVNMLYGYGGGSDIIRRIAEILSSETKGTAEVFCQGSIDFSVLFDTNDEQTVREYYERVSARLAAGVEADNGSVPVTISGGAIINNAERLEIQDMRSSLVYALEESFYSQRNSLVFYNRGDESAQSDIALLSEIHRDALSEMKFFRLRYQPIVDIETEKTIGAEALLAWLHPVYGDISAGKFIAFIETDPCYYRLGLRIIDRAVADAKRFREKIPGFRINVNITALQLQDARFADDVVGILDSYGYPHEGLVLELTERCKEMENGFLAAKIADLRSRGILVAFDDFGTGYSTINLLMNIHIDEIKLDKDFVHDLIRRENYQIFVRSLVLGALSGKNSFTICFEGIEDREILDFVRQYGNFLAQGYYFAKPMFADGLDAYIDKENR